MRMIQLFHTDSTFPIIVVIFFIVLITDKSKGFIIIVSMIAKQKKIWSQQEDIALKKMYEEEGEQSWSIIAKRLASEFSYPRKSAKQCRERYENHICSEGLRVEWSIEEEKQLVQLHNQMGNKWSLIASRIPGKTDNCIKNHFYSKLRKILRKLNSVIHAHLRRQYRQINIGTLYKIVEATQQRFKEQPACGYSVSVACQEVQNRMLTVSMLQEEEFDSEERLKIYSDIIRDVVAVSKLYKRKSRKSRNSAIQAPNSRKKKIRDSHIIVKKADEQGYDSDNSSDFGEEEEEQQAKQMKPQIVVQADQTNIRDILKDAGILKQQQSQVDRSVIRFSSRSSFKSYSENNNIESDNQFFDDSENQKGFIQRRKGSFFRYKSGLFDNPSEFSEREGGAHDFNFN